VVYLPPLRMGTTMAKKQGLAQALKCKLDTCPEWYVEIAGYLIVGFVFGFLLKYGGRLFLSLLVGALLALWALDYLQLITIHYDLLEPFFGFSAKVSLQQLIDGSFLWLRHHIVETLAVLFGFMVAWKFA